MPVYHSGRLSKTQRPDYNYPLRPMTRDLTVPLAPRNLIVTSPYIEGKTDVRWDNPTLIPENNGLNILGVNVYRCTDNPYNTYIKLNDTPVGVLYYRDETIEQYQVNEDVTATLKYHEPDNRWLVYTQHKPVIIPGTNGKTSFRPQDIKVEIDNGDGNFVEIPAFQLNGRTGEITLISSPSFSFPLEQIIPARLPRGVNGKVRVSYYWLKHYVLSALNQRIYYKVTTVAEEPDNPGHQIETPLDEISARSTFDIEEVDWIWREAIRRNRWILEQQGERVKVFIRKWMGTRCSSYEYTYGQSHHDCPQCFPAGTEITMSDFSRKNIEDIEVGDKVISHTGNIRNITEIMNRIVKEDLVEITSIHKIKISPTKNHPILVLRKEDAKCVRNRKLNCTGNNRCICNNSKAWGKICNRDPLANIKWVEAKDVKEGDYVILPIPVGNTNSFTDSELKILGYYASEGHTGKRDKKSGGMTEEDKRVIFSFNRNEMNTCIKDLQTSIREFGNKGSIFYKKSNYNNAGVAVTSIKMVDLVLSNVGKYAKKKKLSEKLVWQEPIKALKFLGSYFNGDGSQTLNKTCTTINCSSASYQMIRQIQMMLFRCGIVPRFSSRTRTICNPLREGHHETTCNELSIGKNYLNLLAENSFYKKVKFKRSGQCYINSGFIFYPVKKIKYKNFSGTVYNIEVEKDHSYIANGVAVHNCYGTNFQGGFDGPFDIIIAPPETEKSIELADMGLHIRYDWETWTVDLPLLNERDVIVRQNNERYIVGPVNPQGSRGAIYQQHFTISHIDIDDIRYQLPITGGETAVPDAWDKFREDQPTPASPIINDKSEIPEHRIIRGRTVVFENITY